MPRFKKINTSNTGKIRKYCEFLKKTNSLKKIEICSKIVYRHWNKKCCPSRHYFKRARKYLS